MGRFSATIDGFVDSALLAQTQGFRKIALDTLNKVQKKTPVDSGALRRSWTVALNAVPSNYDGSQIAIAQARLSDTIVIATDKPYAPMLEYGLYPSPSKTGKTRRGYSVQAPQGMIRISVDEINAYYAQHSTL
ncbi:HK97 gp10 family phage protein [Haemophilus parahaemolyticus]|uniref:HK97 gp10 family phage protein n=1 Tax=Haemophilus parahaemolyticus TaxID=735 RepID=A0A369Z465_HAEPH|nr:HK97 gp10 family phage protein [Haemophilus parahaemolyticus]RDE99750.1 HK97 gp10 family phage protein [Haemophilus parahaemolyticus]